MNDYRKKAVAALLAGILSVAILSGCAAKPAAAPESAESQQAQGQEQAPEQAQQYTEYELPILGMNIALPETLMQRMEQDVALFGTENGTEDGACLQYGLLSWYLMTEEQQQSAPGEVDPADMQLIGVLGVYRAEAEQQLGDLTGCDEHEELAQSADGMYRYYLSIKKEADEDLIAALRDIRITVTEMADFAQNADDISGPGFTGTSLGEFSTQDINGDVYTQEIFQDYDLTLVNIFATWCSPCVAEMPDLEKLHQQVAGKGVNVIGIVLDALDEKGEIVQQSLEQARRLVEKTGVTYPILLPDSTYLNGRLSGIQAVPETFFVDKDGNIVGETYSGSGDLEYWLDVVEQELANLKEGA